MDIREAICTVCAAGSVIPRAKTPVQCSMTFRVLMQNMATVVLRRLNTSRCDFVLWYILPSKSSLFWALTQRMLAAVYWRFATAYVCPTVKGEDLVCTEAKSEISHILMLLVYFSSPFVFVTHSACIHTRLHDSSSNTSVRQNSDT
jgi:hypothetical protein